MNGRPLHSEAKEIQPRRLIIFLQFTLHLGHTFRGQLRLVIKLEMSSSQSRGGGNDRTFHQDYIARIRYSNALPPPPHPTKLLDIPNTGLSSGQYTAPGFASRLARDQPLNIEADAELGMHLDLVGMPGVFDGDESCMFSHSSPFRISSSYLLATSLALPDAIRIKN